MATKLADIRAEAPDLLADTAAACEAAAGFLDAAREAVLRADAAREAAEAVADVAADHPAGERAAEMPAREEQPGGDDFVFDALARQRHADLLHHPSFLHGVPPWCGVPDP
jgi:hypothetical protein